MNNATQNKTSAYRYSANKYHVNKYCVNFFRFVLILGLAMVGSSKAIAFYGNNDVSDDVSLLEIYREKKYKGALDEEDLKVLVLLPKANSSANRSEDKALEEADEGF